MAALANLLTGQMTRPVFDKTGLTVKYDFVLEFEPESGGMAARNPPPADASPGAGTDTAPTIAAALQMLGLKLEAKKAPVESVIVDKIEKTPTEN